MTQLAGRTVIVTGAAGGIGAASVRTFVNQGANVLAADLSEESLQSSLKDMPNSKVCLQVTDVTSAQSNLEMAAKAIERFGQIDGFFANAGIEGPVSDTLSYDEAAFDKVMAVNVKGVWLGLRAVLPHMIERRQGSVVITSSVAGVQGAPGITPYSTSKHAVIGLCRSVAKEVAPYNIRVNTVNPSPVETNMMRRLEQGMAPNNSNAAKTQIASRIPLNRYADPSEIAKVVAFLLGDDASWVTAAVNMVDGGNTA